MKITNITDTITWVELGKALTASKNKKLVKSMICSVHINDTGSTVIDFADAGIPTVRSLLNVSPSIEDKKLILIEAPKRNLWQRIKYVFTGN